MLYVPPVRLAWCHTDFQTAAVGLLNVGSLCGWSAKTLTVLIIRCVFGDRVRLVLQGRPADREPTTEAGCQAVLYITQTQT